MVICSVLIIGSKTTRPKMEMSNIDDTADNPRAVFHRKNSHLYDHTSNDLCWITLS